MCIIFATRTEGINFMKIDQPQLQEYADEVAPVGVGAVQRGPRARFQVHVQCTSSQIL